MTLTQTITRLRRHKSAKVARASGVHVNVVRRIRNGLTKDPRISTLEKLNAGIDAIEGIEHD